MPSQAANLHAKARAQAAALAELVRDVRLRPLTYEQKRVFLHASLASHVAAWESYVERIVENFFSELVDPFSPKYLALHALFQARYVSEVKFFNTPNWENSRRLLLQFTGYDPINDWSWPARGMSGPLLQARLNEILKVRHSFAHGVPMPSFLWNTNATGDARLTFQILSDVDACFRNLVVKTDEGIKRHLATDFGVHVLW